MRISDWSSDVCSSDLSSFIGSCDSGDKVDRTANPAGSDHFPDGKLSRSQADHFSESPFLANSAASGAMQSLPAADSGYSASDHEMFKMRVRDATYAVCDQYDVSALNAEFGPTPSKHTRDPHGARNLQSVVPGNSVPV